MGVYVRGVMLGVSLVAFLGACAKVPYTGRIQSNIVPDGIMRTLGKTTYATMLSGQKLQAKGANATTLTRVGERVSKVANQPKYDWSYSLIVDDAVNALVSAWRLHRLLHWDSTSTRKTRRGWRRSWGMKLAMPWHVMGPSA